MTAKTEISLYRAVTKAVPAPKDYKSPQERGRSLPEGASDEDRAGWDALSAWSTAELAAEAARTMLSAKWVVRYDLPEGHGLRYEPSPPPGHFHIWIGGDHEKLHGYLAPDFAVEIPREEAGNDEQDACRRRHGDQ